MPACGTRPSNEGELGHITQSGELDPRSQAWHLNPLHNFKAVTIVLPFGLFAPGGESFFVSRVPLRFPTGSKERYLT